MRGSGIIASVVILIGITWVVWGSLKNYEAHATAIKYVRTEGVFQYISKSEVKEILLPLVKTGFFSADIEAIKEAVEQMPWVDKVSVKRVWPDAIDIKVYEQAAVARWGNNSLLNVRGEVFTPSNVDRFDHLPMLVGPSGQQQKVLEIMKGISTTLTDRALGLTEFVIDERRSWRIVLSNGTEVLLGRKEQLKSFQRFLKTLQLFEPEHIDAMAKVDLRYPNGYTVLWKPEAKTIDWKKMAAGRRQS